MSPLEREIEIIKLEDQRMALGGYCISHHLPYEERVVAQAKYRLAVKEIDQQIRELRSQK